MTTRLFVKVLLANCLVIIGFNLLMVNAIVRNYLLGEDRKILTGIILYTFQLIMTRFLLDDSAGWLLKPFKSNAIVKGVAGFVISLVVTVGFVSVMDPASQATEEGNLFTGFLPVFLLNSLPGALMEEWLFRYFPVRFAESGALRIPYNSFYLLILLLFSMIHIPVYLAQHNSNLTDLGNIFVSGIFLLVIYMMTKNIVFTSLFHAFCNNPRFPTESSLNWQYFYASIFIVTLLWAFSDYRRALRAVGRKDWF